MAMVFIFLLAASALADHGPVCSAGMPSATILADHLGGSPAIRHWREANGITTYFDDHRRTLWWVANRKHAAFPAAICRRFGEPVHLRCGGDVRACKALGVEMSKAKF